MDRVSFTAHRSALPRAISGGLSRGRGLPWVNWAGEQPSQGVALRAELLLRVTSLAALALGP